MSDERRLSVLLLLTPPESLRGASLQEIQRVISQPHNVEGLLRESALAIHKFFTAEPVEAEVYTQIQESLASQQAELLRRRRDREELGYPRQCGMVLGKEGSKFRCSGTIPGPDLHCDRCGY